MRRLALLRCALSWLSCALSCARSTIHPCSLLPPCCPLAALAAFLQPPCCPLAVPSPVLAPPFILTRSCTRPGAVLSFSPPLCRTPLPGPVFLILSLPHNCQALSPQTYLCLTPPPSPVPPIYLCLNLSMPYTFARPCAFNLSVPHTPALCCAWYCVPALATPQPFDAPYARQRQLLLLQACSSSAGWMRTLLLHTTTSGARQAALVHMALARMRPPLPPRTPRLPRPTRLGCWWRSHRLRVGRARR